MNTYKLDGEERLKTHTQKFFMDILTNMRKGDVRTIVIEKVI